MQCYLVASTYPEWCPFQQVSQHSPQFSQVRHACTYPQVTKVVSLGLLQVLQHESAGQREQIGFAVSGDAEAESGGGLTAAQQGYLRCQLQMGHLQGMLTQIDGWAEKASGECLHRLSHCTRAFGWRFWLGKHT